MAVAIFSQTPPIEHTFTNATSVVIDHNLGYLPTVTIVIGGFVAFGDVEHNSPYRITITFQNALSGTVLIG